MRSCALPSRRSSSSFFQGKEDISGTIVSMGDESDVAVPTIGHPGVRTKSTE